MPCFEFDGFKIILKLGTLLDIPWYLVGITKILSSLKMVNIYCECICIDSYYYYFHFVLGNDLWMLQRLSFYLLDMPSIKRRNSNTNFIGEVTFWDDPVG